MVQNNVNGKVVLIAGGAKNLGGLLSRNFAAKGAKLIIHYNSASTLADAEKTLTDVQAAGAEAILFQGDLTRPKNITLLFDAAIARFGGIDIAINTVKLNMTV
jgi:NAD(P)-dependent dehydrogenase (short-subunit alcohol dehydrogenase family)